MKKIYLSATSAVLGLLGLMLILAPQRWLASFGVTSDQNSLLPLLRGFGGFHLGYAAWLLAATRQPATAKAAIGSGLMVMAGFLAGRAAGFMADNRPGWPLLVSAGVELAFLAWGIVLLAKPARSKTDGPAD